MKGKPFLRIVENSLFLKIVKKNKRKTIKNLGFEEKFDYNSYKLRKPTDDIKNY